MASSSAHSFPDYYRILGVSDTATFDQIKTAYKRASLRCHPDRVPPGPANDARRKAATVEFQAVADAHYTLSDPQRRKAYDELRRANASRWTDDAGESGNWWDYFGAGRGTGAQQDEDDEDEDADSAAGQRPDPEHVFGNVFEELLRPEVNRALPLWTWSGAAAGATLGFIAGNLAGAAVGGFAGSKLGAIRDAKGKAVYAVFKDLDGAQKAQVLAALASKVFGSVRES
ncbi:DnaJ domain-containing protein [Rhodotorula diobovata]|uniref:DnaJ domain-containing protein n=1 Tax=Rhodotorula diobovata TaxID=5288 RepID=A0A5C5FY65_9BASI|nr:DnaJ domain-containing protein [Rhodotorula diobovata]